MNYALLHYIMPSTMNKPAISVVMSVYKEPKSAIEPSVQSILSQTFQDFEFILVNDNPTSEETRVALEEIAALDSRIRILTNKENRGLGYALNAAIKEARADLLVRMDTEDISEPKRIEEQIEYMRANPHVDLLFTQWREQDEKGVTSLRTPKASDVAHIKKNFFIKSLLLHPTLMARKSVFVQHPYPEMGRPEDFVLFLKLIRLNYVFALLEEPLYIYKIDRSDFETRYSKIRTYTENYLPTLFRELRWYFYNPYFLMYLARVLGEYVVSRNKTLFRICYESIARNYRTLVNSA